MKKTYIAPLTIEEAIKEEELICLSYQSGDASNQDGLAPEHNFFDDEEFFDNF